MKSENLKNEKVFLPAEDLLSGEVPAGVDRRAFFMRSASIGAAAVLTGCSASEKATQVGTTPPPAAASSNTSPDLEVVKKSKGPVMTLVDEFY
jgi:L-serine dehydratase